MAMPQCMSDDGNQAVFVGTMLQTGDAVALCDQCIVPWAAALLNVMTGVDPAPFLAAVSEPDPVAGVAEGAPSDEPPPAAPADSDNGAVVDPDGEAAEWVKAGEAPPHPSTRRSSGRTPPARSSAEGRTGGNKDTAE